MNGSLVYSGIYELSFHPFNYVRASCLTELEDFSVIMLPCLNLMFVTFQNLDGVLIHNAMHKYM